jgi:hypothetical protein
VFLFVDGEDDPMSSPDAGFGPDNALPFVQCIQLHGCEEGRCVDRSFVQDGGEVDPAHFFQCRGKGKKRERSSHPLPLGPYVRFPDQER